MGKPNIYWDNIAKEWRVRGFGGVHIDHITDAPEVTSADTTITVGTYGFTTEAEATKIITLTNELKTDYNLAKTAINAILSALENVGVVKKS